MISKKLSINFNFLKYTSSYHTSNNITIGKKRLVDNYKYLANYNPNLKIAPVLKSNAYGHGLNLVAKILDRLHPPMFCVDSLYEAYELYKAQIKTNILIMGYVNPENLKIKRLPFAYAIYDLDQLTKIKLYQPQAEVHIKVDTGMNRLGIQMDNLPHFIKAMTKIKNLHIAGLMSHLSYPEKPESSLTRLQLKNFEAASTLLAKAGISPTWKHLGASGALLNIDSKKLAELTNLTRVGIAVYGIDPTGNNTHIKPVLSMTSELVQIKTVHPKEKVGYSGTFEAQKITVIGIIPVGYNDGLDRRLSNLASVKIGKVYCPIIGLISMNMSAIDITNVKNPKIGQTVTIYSNSVDDRNSVAKMARQAGTIPYDLLVHLSPISIKRQVR